MNLENQSMVCLLLTVDPVCLNAVAFLAAFNFFQQFKIQNTNLDKPPIIDNADTDTPLIIDNTDLKSTKMIKSSGINMVLIAIGGMVTKCNLKSASDRRVMACAVNKHRILS